MHNTYICLQHHSILLIIIYIYIIYTFCCNCNSTTTIHIRYSQSCISTHDCILCSILFSLNNKLKMQTCHETCNTRWLAYSLSLTHFLRSACQLILSRTIIVITCELHNDNKWLFDSTFVRILTCHAYNILYMYILL